MEKPHVEVKPTAVVQYLEIGIVLVNRLSRAAGSSHLMHLQKGLLFSVG